MERDFGQLLDHQQGWSMLISRAALQGVTLIEQMVAIAILSIMFAIALPSFGDWIRNTRLRSMAESLRADLQMARAEAIRRNTTTRLQFVTSLDNSCALSASGVAWVVNAGAAQSPEGACSAETGAASAPFLIRKSPVVTSSGADLRLQASRSTLAFDSLGRQTASTAPATSVAIVTVGFSSRNNTCAAAGGSVRCLNVVVSPAGDSRVCDPARTAATDPMRC